ncbi:TPA: hypothetical protein SMM93_000704 [Proteus mirabilis]|uniref:hypothetical protein n=1 Tax=Proteus sp. fly-1013 TaxID=3136673 RepID=UPI0029DFA439|nr:hypothetical protein [Proteus mirabilis]
MTIRYSGRFQEFPNDNFIAHTYDFFIDEFNFILFFTQINIMDKEYLCYRSEEAGFEIIDNCYDLKFDRKENFLNETYYKPPEKGMCSRKFHFQKELTEALEMIITLHCKIYASKAYLFIAENHKLKRYYDRILQALSVEVVTIITNDIGETGRGYAIKTRYF